MGFAGDFYHQAVVPPGATYSPYSRVVGCADILGVDPSGMAETAKTSRTEEELAALYGDLEDGDGEEGGGGYRFAAAGRLNRRPAGLKPAKR
ncbi:hypothetical protein [Enterovirga sp.]|uniref:hypothetical protein n=1 Tax=Enterovirga sp. TaxID=2026350 RepID=UPI002C49A579|nr:hypothetical protein [Enterovirga sp.]HMO29949.1 hypothetical protein [Enterovirga sp.]